MALWRSASSASAINAFAHCAAATSRSLQIIATVTIPVRRSSAIWRILRVHRINWRLPRPSSAARRANCRASASQRFANRTGSSPWRWINCAVNARERKLLQHLVRFFSTATQVDSGQRSEAAELPAQIVLRPLELSASGENTTSEAVHRRQHERQGSGQDGTDECHAGCYQRNVAPDKAPHPRQADFAALNDSLESFIDVGLTKIADLGSTICSAACPDPKGPSLALGGRVEKPVGDVVHRALSISRSRAPSLPAMRLAPSWRVSSHSVSSRSVTQGQPRKKCLLLQTPGIRQDPALSP